MMMYLIDAVDLVCKLRNWQYDESKKSRGEVYQTISDCIDLVDKMDSVYSDCFSCLRQGCSYKDGTVRFHCPLFKRSAV